MRAGLLNEPIIVERSHIHRNEYGEEQTVWECHINTRAQVDWKGGNNTFENDERVFTRSVNFVVRSYHDIRPLDRIIWKAEKYRILHIEPRKKEQRQIITAELINE